ncbi:MAG TPA: HAD-IB family phosphatase [Candidatus Norongarragalinales archaeon]|nr:HAD-IB family phosphatase [Candidatus Norongarragalinales archaeon]
MKTTKLALAPFDFAIRIFGRAWKFLEGEKATIAVPAYNEAKYIRRVLKAAKASKLADEILVIDDGSTDGTGNIAEAMGVKVIRHRKNLGKGAAIRTAVRNASGDIIAFFDADLQNITPEKIDSIIKPVADREADFTKAGFELSRGRVTEIAVKPLMKILFPDIGLSQPISGQFCSRTKFLRKAAIEKDWGIDIALLLEAAKEGLVIKEVEIGELIHKRRTDDQKAEMSFEVMKTMLKRAGIISNNYGMVVFDLDNTLIEEKSIDSIARSLGLAPELDRLRNKHLKGVHGDELVATKFAKRLANIPSKKLRGICRRMTVKRLAAGVIKRLHSRRYKLAICSRAYSPVVKYFGGELGIPQSISPELEEENGRFTGGVTFPIQKVFCEKCNGRMCKGEWLKSLSAETGIPLRKMVAVGNGAGDRCMLENAGKAFVIGSEIVQLGKKYTRLQSLPELLVLIE